MWFFCSHVVCHAGSFGALSMGSSSMGSSMGSPGKTKKKRRCSIPLPSSKHFFTEAEVTGLVEADGHSWHS